MAITGSSAQFVLAHFLRFSRPTELDLSRRVQHEKPRMTSRPLWPGFVPQARKTLILSRQRARNEKSPMAFAPIKKDAIGIKVSPNFTDYERTCAEFSWTASERELSRFPAACGLNIAFECVDRHAQGLRRDHLALRWLGKQGDMRDFTYGDLQRLSNRFANVLRALGIGKGDRVFALAGRIPELYITALGTLKNGSVFCPLFSAFGPEPIHQRLSIGEGNVLVTTEALYSRRKIAELRAALPHLKHVLVIRDSKNSTPSGTHEFHQSDERCLGRFRNCAHRSGGHGADSFHLRHDGKTQRRGARAQSRDRPSHYRQICSRLSSRRCFLVHRRSRLGDRHFLRNYFSFELTVSPASSTKPTSTPSAGIESSRNKKSPSGIPRRRRCA